MNDANIGQEETGQDPISLGANDFDLNTIRGSKQGSYCANLENDCPFGRPVKSFRPAHHLFHYKLKGIT